MQSTFKQFLEDTSAINNLELLKYELFFRKEVGISKDASSAAVIWAVKCGRTDAPHPQNIPDDGWTRILEWAEKLYKKKNPKGSIYDFAKRARGFINVEILVKAIISEVMRTKYKLELMKAPISESVNELDELTFVLTLRNEFKCNTQQAKELIQWLKGEKDWEDLDYDARYPILIYFSNFEDADLYSGQSEDEFALQEIFKIMLLKHKLDIRDLK